MIIKLNKEAENEFRKYLLEDFLGNAIYLYDLDKEYPLKVDFYISAENGKINGFGCFWSGNPDFSYLHIMTKNFEVYSKLFNKLSDYLNKSNRLIVPLKFTDVTKEKLGINGIPFDLMFLKKGEERLFSPQKAMVLEKNDLEKTLELIKEGVNLHINDIKIRTGIVNSVKQAFVRELSVGCFMDNDIISFFRAPILYNPLAMVDTLYTKERFRKRGAAISTVSRIIKELFYNRIGIDGILLYEEKENIPAYKLYTKVGFKKVKEYVRFSLS